MLDTYVRLGAQQLGQNDVAQQDRAPIYTPRTVWSAILESFQIDGLKDLIQNASQ